MSMTTLIRINNWYLIPGVSEHAWSCLITWLSSPLRLAPLEFLRAINMLSTSTTPSPSASNCPKACGRNTERTETHNIWRQSATILHTKGEKQNKCNLTIYCSSWIWFSQELCWGKLQLAIAFIEWSNGVLLSCFLRVATIATNIPDNPTQFDKAALCYNRLTLKTRGK